jgi:hypothetical protein
MASAGKARWLAAGMALLVLMLGLPLLLFAWLSYWKLGFVSWSYYVPYEEFWQGLASAKLGKIYYAPLVAVNVTSGFVTANMFTYTLGHTLVTLALVALVMAYLAAALRRSRQCAAAVRAPAGGATAGVFTATAASSSAALTGCCGAGMTGGIVALAGLGSATGAWMSDAATWAQFLLVVGLAVALAITFRRNSNVERDFEPAGWHPDLSRARSARFHRPVRSAGTDAGLKVASALENHRTH